MKRMMIQGMVAFALACAVATGSRAADVLPLNLHQLTAGAQTIFEGKCLANRVERDPQSGLIFTRTTFEVLDSLKGSVGVRHEIRQYGGIFPDGSGLLVASLPHYSPGERVILFLHAPSSKGLTSPVGSGQGKFLVSPREDIPGFRVRNMLQNQSLFQGMRADSLARRDAQGRILPEDRPIRNALKTGNRGIDLTEFKTLVRRLSDTPLPPDLAIRGARKIQSAQEAAQ